MMFPVVFSVCLKLFSGLLVAV